MHSTSRSIKPIKAASGLAWRRRFRFIASGTQDSPKVTAARNKLNNYASKCDFLKKRILLDFLDIVFL
jgi:hypothetical protein